MNRYASAISEHPVAAQAVGELAGSVLEQLEGSRVDLLVVFVSPHFAGATEDIGGVLRAVLEPRVLVGSTNAAVIGAGREVEGRAAIALWAAHFDAGTSRVVKLAVDPYDDGVALVGWPADSVADAHTLLLFADPFTFPVDGVLRAFAVSHPHLQVIGGMASAANGPGVNRRFADDLVLDRGAVGVLLTGDDPVTAVVSQGCRPIGQPYTVTAVDGNYVQELGGRTALERLQEVAAAMPVDEREHLQRGLHVGLVVDEHLVDFGRGDFLVRNVLGARSDDGALAIGATVEIGQTLQFQVRDAAAADADLRHMLAGQSAQAALLMTCTGRGEHLFGTPNHDAGLVRDLLGPIPVAGGFCAGEIGPVGGANHVHGFTASLALFS
ncbi:MAG: FIST N-terminal domain-containing protein [Acidimicrobiia bacterium]